MRARAIDGPDHGDDDSAECPVLHVDMDAFYASVALRERPELREQPVAVGGGHRGVVLAANYRARDFGVHSAMTGARARRLCPDLIFLPPRHEEFASVSRAVMETFARVTPLVESVSLDEAFLDVAGARRRLGSPRQIAEQLRATIHDEQQITCSVGVAPTISVAKIASTRAKPDGVLVVPPDQVTGFLHPLDVGALWGVGDKTRTRLHALGLRTVGDLAHTRRSDLQASLGAHLGAHLHTLAWGADQRAVRARHAPAFGALGTPGGQAAPERSMGAQRTFARDTTDRSVLLREILSLTTTVAGRLRAAEVVARTVALTVRAADFTTTTRSRSLAEPTDLTLEVFEAATLLLDRFALGRTRVRLVGVRVEGLRARESVHHQHVLGERERGWSQAEQAVDRAVRRFGGSAVRPATLLR